MGPPLGHRQSSFFVILKNQNSFFLVPQKFFVLTFTKRYVDYHFVSFNSHEQLKKFVEYMNTKDPYIRFTLGHKNNNLFSFLDVKICREIKNLTFSVYRKFTLSRVLSNFKSFVPKVYKFGLAVTLLHHC